MTRIRSFLRDSPRIALAAIGCAIALAFLCALTIGPTSVNVLGVLFGPGGEAQSLDSMILFEIRLPRALLAVIVGASLGLSGAALQSLMRNPLAEPGVIGISAAGALGAVLAIYTGLSTAFPLALPVLSIAFSLAAAFALILLSARGGVLTLILAGVGITSLCGALTSLALNLSTNPFAALEIVYWLLGSLADRSMDHVWLAAPFCLLGWGMLLTAARALDVYALGETTAASLGVRTDRTRFLVTFGAALCVGAVTAVAGVIGFVGLIAPHLLRPLIGDAPSRLLPGSALAGAALVLIADIVARTAIPDTELKLGVVTSLIGAPFFIALILRTRIRESLS